MTTFIANVNAMMKASLPSTGKFAILNTTAYTADQLGATDSLAIVNTPITGRPHDNHGAYLSIASVNTPFQLMLADTSNRYIWKRYKTSAGWQAWFKLDAGHADTWTTARTLTIGGTGKSVNGGADVSWSMNEIMGSSDSSKFYRGDKVWSNTLANNFLPGAENTYTLGSTTACWGSGYSRNWYLYANGTQFGRLGITTIGTANSGTDNATRGSQGYAALYLGNNIPRPAAGTAGGANNARGRIYLYHSDETYTLIYSDSWNNHNLTVVGTTDAAEGATGSSYLILGNSSKKSAAAASSTGYIRMYGDENYYQQIYPGSPSANRTHYFPNATGWIATGGNGTSTGAGNATTPVFLSTAGILTEISSGTTGQFYRGDCVWSNTLAGDLLVSGTINKFKFVQGAGINPDNVRTSNGWWVCNTAPTGVPISNHGSIISIGDVGTPSQFYIADSSHFYIYKRYYSSSAWSAWTKIYAGYADSAGVLNTARTFTIGSTGKTFNGSANVSWSHAEMGVLPLSGGTMTGTITLASTGLIYPAASGYRTDSSGNFTHKRTTSTDTFNIYNNAGTSTFAHEWETGNLRITGNLTAQNVLPCIITTSCNANSVSQGLYIVAAAITNAPTTNHGALLYISSVGTPFQIFFPDNLPYVYKRWYTSGAWTSWQIMGAGWL